MCRNPRRILNPSKWIDPYSCQSLYIDVPCGHCSECIVSYRNDWRNRAYYETLDTFASGGYVLFDTLTYRNGNLPHLSDWVDVPKSLDFPCFSKYDLDLFFANLRRKLRKYDVSNNLRYFVGCEYGDDIRFTRRPHYHVLFFVNTKIPVSEMSKAIALSWTNGRTDGVPYRGINYVVSNCVFTSLSESQKFSVNYVTKYCTKDFSYSSLVNNRLDRLKVFDYFTYKLAKNYVKCNHYQSKSFGLNALIKFVGKESLLSEGKFKVIQSNGFFRYVNLSKSIQRKLLYDYSRDSNGCVFWKLNKDGYEYKKRFAYRSIDYIASHACGDGFYDFGNGKSDAFKYLFQNNRFVVSDDIGYIIDNSYNITKGLRNYCCCDFDFLRKKIFTYVDYGSKKLGFLAHLSLSNNDFVFLNDLKKIVGKVDIPIIERYKVSIALNGDGALDAMKLIHRLKFIHSKFHYEQVCY